MILYSLFMTPISILAKAVLFTMGWSLLHIDIFNQITKYDRTVLIFSHTSYADFYILILYLLAYPRRLHSVRTLVKPQPFEYAGPLLRWLGAIPSTKIEDKNGGAVNRIVNTLKECEKFIFLISPKGTIINKPWRSGYYHIAKDLNAHLMVAGLDYETKQVIVSKEISPSNEEPFVKEFLQDQLKPIVPLFPEGEVVPIRSHDPNKRGIINRTRTFSVLLLTLVAFQATYLFYSFHSSSPLDEL